MQSAALCSRGGGGGGGAGPDPPFGPGNSQTSLRWGKIELSKG